MEPRIIPLWLEGEAPYAAQSPGQAPPSLKAFEADGADIAIVVCPGGAYFLKTPHEGDPASEAFCARGFSCYTLDYRVKPCHPMAPLADALRAVRAVRAMGYRRVGILGFSAGGHIACCAAVHGDAGDPAAADPVERQASRPDFFVPCYAVVSFTQYPHIGSVCDLLDDPDRHDLRRFFSAELNVTAQTPPAFIWHTADDGLVPVEHSLLLAGALSRCGVPFELHVYPQGMHGMGIGRLPDDLPEGIDIGPFDPGIAGWPDDCARFIRRYV